MRISVYTLSNIYNCKNKSRAFTRLLLCSIVLSLIGLHQLNDLFLFTLLDVGDVMARRKLVT